MAISTEYDSTHFIVDAINILLQTINELPIETLEDIDNILEAQIAQSVIIEAKKAILTEGWDINTDTNYPFQPTTDGIITIPAGVLDLRVGSTIIVRDWMLYDKVRHSRKFTETQFCDVTWNLDFNTLPHAIRYYITLVAAQKFQARMITDSTMYSFTTEDINNALIVAKQSNGFTSNFNMLDTVSMKSL